MNEGNKRACDWSIWHMTSVKFVQIIKSQNGCLPLHIFLAYVLNKHAERSKKIPPSTCLSNFEWFSKMYYITSDGCTLRHMVASLQCGQAISNALLWWDMRLKLLNINCVVFIMKCYQFSTSETRNYTGNLLMIRNISFRIAPRVLGEVLFNLASVCQRQLLTRKPERKHNLSWTTFA